MVSRWSAGHGGAWISLALALCLCGQARAESADTRALLEKGDAALAQNHLREAAEAFQKAVDSDPSSVRAHEQLGVTLLREITLGNVRPSADSDVSERAEDHLKRAIELAPFAGRPLMELSDLDAALAERATDPGERSNRYHAAQDLLKKAVALDPSKPDMYLRLAGLERDEFGPVLQQAKAQSPAGAGPLPDAELRHSLQQQYGALVDDAIANAQKASQMNANSPRPLLLVARLLRQRAILRDTAEQYNSDMHSAEDWERQFLTAGGHLGSSETGAHNP